MDKHDFFSMMIQEADAYTSLELIESNIEKGTSLANLPLQPLYMAFRNMAPEVAASYLPKLSSQQRQIFLDLDLWEKDNLDVNGFEHWMDMYSRCKDDEVKQEFAEAPEFAMYLKARVNIWTFDVEDPQYPDHDNYFLTEDNLLLVEFHDDFEHAEQVQQVIKDLYSKLGVENAYAYLFKIVSDSYLNMQEEEYQLKNNRLKDVGFVDYYEALEMAGSYPSIDVLNARIKKKSKVDIELDPLHKNQKLDRNSLMPFKERMDTFLEELANVQSQERIRFLEFNFVRLVNGTIVLGGNLKEGAVAVNRAGKKTKAMLEMGLDYLKKVSIPKGDLVLSENESVLDYFDFADLYRIGNTLISLAQRKVKLALKGTPFEDENEAFLGPYWVEFLDNSLDQVARFEDLVSGRSEEIRSWSLYQEWDARINVFSELMPFIHKLYLVFESIANEGRLHDSFYLNYDVNDIDFEAVLLSSFANHSLRSFEKMQGEEKLALTLNEFKTFAREIIDSDGKLIRDDNLRKKIADFVNGYGLAEVPGIENYLEYQLAYHLEGYDYNELAEADYKHVGGPIIFNMN